MSASRLKNIFSIVNLKNHCTLVYILLPYVSEHAVPYYIYLSRVLLFNTTYTSYETLSFYAYLFLPDPDPSYPSTLLQYVIKLIIWSLTSCPLITNRFYLTLWIFLYVYGVLKNVLKNNRSRLGRNRIRIWIREPRMHICVMRLWALAQEAEPDRKPPLGESNLQRILPNNIEKWRDQGKMLSSILFRSTLECWGGGGADGIFVDSILQF
jgi:hypothetical protein